MVLHTTIGKRRSGAFKQKKVYQNRTIIKEVISKNVFFLLALALALGSGPEGWTGPDPGSGPSVQTRGPAPADPAPADPAPVDPALGVGQVRTRGLDLVDPAPGPAPEDPALADLAPGMAPVDAAPVGPAPMDPAPLDLAPADPAPVDPALVDLTPAGHCGSRITFLLLTSLIMVRF